MAYSRPFGYDPLTGGKETIHFDDDGKIRIVKETDVEPVLRRNYDLRMQTDATKWGDSWDRDGETFIHFAGIPLDIYHNDKLVPPHLRHDGQELLKWLQKPEQEAFKCHFGKFA